MTRSPADGPRRAVGATALRASVAVLHIAVIAGGFTVLSGHAAHSDRGAGRPVLPDIHVLTEDMPIDDSAVPPLPGTQWGTIIAVPQGGPAPVEPPQCGIFLSQGEVTQKALAMRSSGGAAIGIELAVTPRPVQVHGLDAHCESFSLTTPELQSTTRVEPADFGPIPAEAISVVMHTRTTTKTQSLAWDIAMIVGVHRGLLVTAEYTPGPRGAAFDSSLAEQLPALYEAQTTRLDKS
ncbi:MAG: hypothetical protein PGN37_14415 [Mycobacterium kyogaense]|uniref:hypothetical protein n=1 Tax=Mycobacterium kyogaense TaxID=2212479 RepID=UPI002FFB218A